MDIYSLDFSNDGKFIVSGSGDKRAKIWDVEKGEVSGSIDMLEITCVSVCLHWAMMKLDPKME